MRDGRRPILGQLLVKHLCVRVDCVGDLLRQLRLREGRESQHQILRPLVLEPFFEFS
jgi:hypothetical protein